MSVQCKSVELLPLCKKESPVRRGSLQLSTREPLEELDWFHPKLSRHAAECMLIDNAPEGSFLLRPSSDSESYVLSVKLSSSVQHIRLRVGPGSKYQFGNSSFDDVRSLRRHFELEKPVIGGDSGIRVILKYPYTRFVEENHLYTEVVHHAVTRMLEDSESDSESSGETSGTMDPQKMAISSKEGYLTKQGKIRKSWRVRWFVLRNNTLSYYRTRHHKKPIRTLDMTKVMAVQLDNSKRKDFCFRLVLPSRVFYFLGNSLEDCQQWVEILRSKIPKV